MKKVLTGQFFARPVLEVAPDLLGKYLVRDVDGKEIALKITETEAYDGEKDLACHAAKGRTARTEVMFGQSGIFYVYLCYGMYFMLNAVTGPKDYAAAVLIRGVEGFDGPGKLTRFFKIGKELHGKAISPESGVWIEDRGEKVSPKEIIKTPRIGIASSGPIWSKKLYRFVLEKKKSRV